MGPYCEFCNHRCFVERRLPFKTGSLLMATCLPGAAHDREVTGHDHTTSVNPHDAIPAEIVDYDADLERARSLAASLEQENAHLASEVNGLISSLAQAEERAARWYAAAHELGAA